MKKSLKNRIVKVNDSLDDVFPVSCMPIKYYYYGVSILSKKLYFNWIHNKIIKNDVPEKWKNGNYKVNISLLVYLAGAGEKVTEDDYRLIYQLIIEPFYEIYKEEGDKKYDKTNDCERNI